MATGMVAALAPDGRNLFRLIARARKLADELGCPLNVMLMDAHVDPEENARRLESAYRLCRYFGAELNVFYSADALPAALRRLGASDVQGAVVGGDREFARRVRGALPDGKVVWDYVPMRTGGAALIAACAHG